MIEYQIENTKNSLLEPYIENYVKVKVNCDKINSKELLPRPGASWLFINQPFIVDNERYHSNCLIGIRDRSAHLTWKTNCLEGFSVKFTSFGLSRFVNVPIPALKNETIDFEEIRKGNKGVEHLATSILEVLSLEEKIAFIESFLIRSLSKCSSIENRIFHFANQIKDNPSGDVNNSKKGIPLSTRQLERKFKELLGVNLQTFIRICRFDHAKNQLMQGRKSKLTLLGYDSGYFDQAHFSKEFKRFSLLSPKRFPVGYPFYNLMAEKHW